MLFAFDHNDCRVHIDETQSNRQYYCPYCGTPLITRKGDIRQHHFAHKPHHLCSDSWERGGSYDISPWHNEWQENFPKENQEIMLSLGETKHRADVLIQRTVVEFQHSILSEKAFDDRNNFYFNLNYKVVWLFDLTDIIESGNLSYLSEGDTLSFTWRNPKKAFNSYDVKAGCIDLFFQISNEDSACIVKVLDVSDFGFESFTATNLKSKNDFLEYLGVENGTCSAPDREDLENNESYLRFKEKYAIQLNKQQERTVQSIEGSVLLLAVPGSGKTTVLVDRLGYMVCEKGIDPGKILAVTYTDNAAEEMKERYNWIFGKESGNRIKFQAINSLSRNIYTKYCEKFGKEIRSHLEETERTNILSSVYREFHPDELPSYGDIFELGTSISYVKNMMLQDDQIAALDLLYSEFSSMYNRYHDILKEQNKMDFDDQMVYAYSILTKRPNQALFWQEKYHYICVDEAQDTSKIQHAIIQTLAKGNNLFMVGDEDQSIYGFRAAYPKALLNFRTDYNNPYILRMERNYRSTPQIVEKAQTFISENTGRYEKTMVADRENGKPVGLIPVNSVREQYEAILSIAQKAEKETAFLYRDNESSVVLVDSFLRNHILFRMKKPEMNFFEINVVKDIIAHLSLVIDPYDAESLRQVCNKGLLYLKKQQLDYAIQNCRQGKTTVFDALEGQMKYLPQKHRERAEKFKNQITSLTGKKPKDAIALLLESGYKKYLEEKNLDYGKIETLLILAEQEPDIANYLKRLYELKEKIQEGFNKKGNVILSTIHSSKGLEYDTVYLLDVYDGRFPASKRNFMNMSKDSTDGEQEERRLFYVGITRAKNELYLFGIKGKPSSYINSLFPEWKRQQEFEKQEALVRQREEMQKLQAEHLRQLAKENRIRQAEIEKGREQQKQLLEKKRKEEAEKRRIEEEKALQEGYDEVKDLFTQQETPIYDPRGNRWVQCEKCGKILPSDKFISYGGLHQVNMGLCYNCRNKT